MNEPRTTPSAPNEAAASTPERLRVVVVSDIHATDEPNDETNVAKENAENLQQNALTSIRPFLKDKIDKADFLICPGDLIHQGVPAPMKWVWTELHALANELEAELISTAGNHDLSLEPDPGRKPSSSLRELEPGFPNASQGSLDEYWAHGFAILDRGPCRLLVINSSDHLGGFHQGEAAHGRFGPDCERSLRERLGDADASINICVFHHHPQEWTVDSDDRVNHMRGGDRLIEILEKRPEPWMLVHGHTHFPRLDYLGHSSGGPVRLASGSIGANLLGLSGTKVRNQMHVLEFDLVAAVVLGLRIAGRIHSYDWVSDVGWSEALPASGLAAHTTFGYRRDGYELARWLQSEAPENRKAWRWDELVDIDPRLAFLSDADRTDFFNAARRFGAGVQESIMEVTFP